MAPLDRNTLLRLQKQNNVFVETGTHVGSSLKVAISIGYKKIYSVEFHEGIYNTAKKEFQNFPNVYLYLGDSATELGNMLAEVTEPSTIFLDAHFCGVDSNTGLSDIWIPVENELKSVKKYAKPGSVIIIDDLMAMDNTHFDVNTKKWAGAPGIEKLLKLVFDINPNFKLTVKDDRLICDLEDKRSVVEKSKEVLSKLNDERVKNKSSLVEELIQNIKKAGYPTYEYSFTNSTDVNELEKRKIILSEKLEEIFT